MKPELLALVQVSAWTALLWIPYVLNRMLVWGLMDTMGYPAEKKPLAPWAERLRSAHANAIENLAVFAPLRAGRAPAGHRQPGHGHGPARCSCGPASCTCWPTPSSCPSSGRWPSSAASRRR